MRVKGAERHSSQRGESLASNHPLPPAHLNGYTTGYVGQGLTPWEIKSLGESGAGSVATTPTASKPTTAQPTGVSRDGEIVPQDAGNDNPDIRFSRNPVATPAVVRCPLYIEEVRTGKDRLAMTSVRKYPAAKNASESIQTVLLNVRNDGGELHIVYPHWPSGQAEKSRCY